jgi:serine/threonine protein kinase
LAGYSNLGKTDPEFLDSQSDLKYIDNKVDIFCFGLLIYEIVTGVSFLVGKDLDQIFTANQTLPLISKEKSRIELPFEFWDLLSQMLESKKEDRVSVRDALLHSYFIRSDKYSKKSKDLLKSLEKLNLITPIDQEHGERFVTSQAFLQVDENTLQKYLNTLKVTSNLCITNSN